jgi:Tol biopolymer transport system component
MPIVSNTSPTDLNRVRCLVAAAGACLTIGLAGLLSAAPATATFPGDNGVVAFSQGILQPGEDLSGHSQVFTIDPGGGPATQLTHVSAKRAAAVPDTSPDGSRIVYESNQSGAFSIWMMNADGSAQHRLTHRKGVEDFLPSWSPNAAKILFSRCAEPLGPGNPVSCGIAVMNANGSHQRTLLKSGHRFNLKAQFSPNGEKIVFSSDRAGFQSAIWVMKANGSSLRRLTRPGLRASWPDWFPSGNRIVFADNCCVPHSNIWSVRSDGTGLRRITKFKALKLNAAFPSVSPDGEKISFSFSRGCTETPCKGFYTMRTDGSHLHRVATGRSNIILTDWGPAS